MTLMKGGRFDAYEDNEALEKIKNDNEIVIGFQ